MDQGEARRKLEASGFTPGQAEAALRAIANAGLGALKRDLSLLEVMVGISLVLSAAMLWQVVSLRGHVDPIGATLDRIDDRPAGIAAGPGIRP